MRFLCVEKKLLYENRKAEDIMQQRMEDFEKYIFVMNVWMEDNACKYPNFLNWFIEIYWTRMK